MNSSKNSFFVLLALIFAFTVSVGISSAQASVDLSGWNWSSNIGWISFNSVDANAGGGPYKVTISTTTLNPGAGFFNGYAWSPNIGWIKFGGLSNFPTAAPSYERVDARINLGTGVTMGFARACVGTLNSAPNSALPGDCSSMASRADGWDGWIELAGMSNVSKSDGSGGVFMDPATGQFKGYAWGGDVVGWIQFFAKCPSCVLPTAAPACSVTATPNIVNSGGSATITWASSNVTSCTGINFSTGGVLNNATGITVSGITSNTTYSMSCQYPVSNTIACDDSAATVTVNADLSGSCSITPPSTIAPKGAVTINAIASGGSGSSYTYVLHPGDGSSSENFQFGDQSISHQYLLAGSYSPYVTISDGVTFVDSPACPGGVTVTVNADLSGSCSITPPSTIAPKGAVTINAIASGGSGSYTYTLNPDDGTSQVPFLPGLQSISHTYSSVGNYSPFVTISDGSNSPFNSLACPGGVTVNNNNNPSLAGSSLLIGETFSGATHTNLRIIRGNPFFLKWALSGDSCTATITSPDGLVVPPLWKSTWNDSVVMANQDNRNGPPFSLNTNMSGVAYGRYQFLTSCTDNSDPGNPVTVRSQPPVILDITNSDGGHF